MSRFVNSSNGLRQKGSSQQMMNPSAVFALSDKSSEVLLDIDTETGDKTDQQCQEDGVWLLCFDISTIPPTVQFLMLTAAVFLFYLIYGYIQELIFTLEGFRPYGWYLTLVQFACYSIFGIGELQFKADRTRRIPLKTYFMLAGLTVATMGLSNTAVGYLNYPTQVIFKCCKLIPVLIGGIFIQGKRFSIIDVTAVMCMCMGLILFTLADSTVSPSFNMYGILLISMALCADGAIGNVQEKVLKQYSASNSEVVLYSYSIGFVYIFVGLLTIGGLKEAFTFCIDHPVRTYGYAVLFSLTGYIGLNIVLTMVKTYGALIAVTVTTCRKAVTIVLSFIFFTKPFTFQYIWSGCIVVLGIYLNLYSKNKESWNKRIVAIYRQLAFVGRRRGVIDVAVTTV